MQVALHIGAHVTDEGRLYKCLKKNETALAQRGVMLPDPGRFQTVLRDTLIALVGASATPRMRRELLDEIVDGAAPDRLVLSAENLVCMPHRIFDKGKFYNLMHRRIRSFAELFAGDEIEIHLGIRNPATFVPAVYRNIRKQTFDEFLHGINPMDIVWSELVERILDACPEAHVSVWCNEDTPLIWGELVREVGGMPANLPITGGYDLLADIMNKEGMERFLNYMKTHPPVSELQKRRVIAAFLDKFAIDDEMEIELDLPGWSDEMVERMTELYDQDVDRLTQMPGVHVIMP